MKNVLQSVTFAPDPDPGLVERLESLVDLARSGELKSFYGFGHMSDGGLLTTRGPSDDHWRDMAALEQLKYRMQQSVEE